MKKNYITAFKLRQNTFFHFFGRKTFVVEAVQRPLNHITACVFAETDKRFAVFPVRRTEQNFTLARKIAHGVFAFFYFVQHFCFGKCVHMFVVFGMICNFMPFVKHLFYIFGVLRCPCSRNKKSCPAVRIAQSRQNIIHILIAPRRVKCYANGVITALRRIYRHLRAPCQINFRRTRRTHKHYSSHRRKKNYSDNCESVKYKNFQNKRLLYF